jgi:hypothetical protein
MAGVMHMLMPQGTVIPDRGGEPGEVWHVDFIELGRVGRYAVPVLVCS